MLHPTKVTVHLSKSDYRDMLKEKKRLQLSLSELLRRAWALSKDKLKALPSVRKS